MRIGIFNPYLDSLGGGERYVITLASHWSKKHDVFLFWNDNSIIKASQDRFNIDLSRVKTAQNFFQSRNVLKKARFSKKYDLIFFLSDGSVPTSFAKRNILHFQVPFARIQANPLKLRAYQTVVCNSKFTKNNLDPTLGKRSIVIYPPVDVSQFHLGEKENIVLSVGRFSSFFQAKKQEILIEIWKKAKFRNWKLILAGGLLPSDQEYFNKLTSLASGDSIQLIPNIAFPKLVNLYSKASVYWHAAGFGEQDPTLAEHFGITTVEAMASGCIPIVYNGGGLPEIIEDGVHGYLWNTPEELIEKTKKIDKNQLMRKKAIKRAKNFDVRVFNQAFDDVLTSLF